MLRRILYTCYVILLTLSFLLPACTFADTHTPATPLAAIANFPIADPNYIYNQLAYTTSHFQARQAGFTANGGA